MLHYLKIGFTTPLLKPKYTPWFIDRWFMLHNTNLDPYSFKDHVVLHNAVHGNGNG